MNATTCGVLPLLDGIRAHLGRHELPNPVGVSVSRWGRSVVVQLDVTGLARLARALLAWASSLSEVTVNAWRVPGGYSVHLTVEGRLPSGVPVHVYDSLDFDPAVFPDLPTDTHQDIELSVLHRWASARAGVA